MILTSNNTCCVCLVLLLRLLVAAGACDHTHAEGHVYAVRKLLSTPGYGCKAVNLGRGGLGRAGRQMVVVAGVD